MEQSSKTHTWQHVISYLQVGSLWILLASLPFRIGHGAGAFPRIAMIVAGVLFVVEYIANKRWRNWHWHRDKWLYIAMIAYYLLALIWHIGSSVSSPRLSFVLQERLPLVLCAVIGLLGLNHQVKLRHIGYVFIISSFLTSIYIIANTTNGFFFLHTPQEQSYLFTQARIRLVNSHMMYNLYLNISLIFAFYILSQEKLKYGIRALLIMACLWIFYLLCLTEGRVGLATGLLLGVSFVLIYSYKRGLKLLIPVMVAYIALCGIIIAQHKRFSSDKIEHEPRWFIWKADLDIIKDSPIIGHGVCLAKDMLIEKAFEEEGVLQQFYRPRINNIYHGNRYKIQPHNAFLEAWGEFGLIGLVLLIFLFIFPLTMQPKKNRIYILMVVGCFCIQSMFDSFFAPLLYSLAIIFFTSQNEISRGNAPQKRHAI